MNVTIKATNMHLSDAIKSYAEEKLSHLTKLDSDLQLARVELEMLSEKHTDKPFRAEVTMDAPHHVYRADSMEADIYAAIDTVVPKLYVQIEKSKKKHISRDRKAARAAKAGQL